MIFDPRPRVFPYDEILDESHDCPKCGRRLRIVQRLIPWPLIEDAAAFAEPVSCYREYRCGGCHRFCMAVMGKDEVLALEGWVH